MPKKKTPKPEDPLELEFDQPAEAEDAELLTDDELFSLKTDSGHVDDMFSEWFLDYASYVILERAVPHANDGLKPVQRRILHSMRELEDGRYNKVANVIGNTMKYHPHGDASIGDAMVQLGQKDLLIDMQGNWGNTFTGDSAAAPRYIEARLSKFALDVVFNPKTTNWLASYDGRNKEPETLPIKFPLLLAQGPKALQSASRVRSCRTTSSNSWMAALLSCASKPPSLCPISRPAVSPTPPSTTTVNVVGGSNAVRASRRAKRTCSQLPNYPSARPQLL